MRCLNKLFVANCLFSFTPCYMPITWANNIDKEPIESITVTASRKPEVVTELANSIAVLDNTTLDLVSPAHIQQVLNRLPGVNFQRNSGQEYLPALRSPVLTGSGACGSFLMLENGIALRPNGFCNVNELFESHYEQATNIEVLRGPATAFYGANGLHGVINIIEPASLQRPNKFSLNVAEHNSISLGLHASSDNLALAATLDNRHGFRDDEKVSQQKISLQHRAEYADYELNSYFTAFNLDQNTAGFVEGKDSYKNAHLSRVNNNPEAYRKANGLRFHQWYQFSSGLQLKPYFRMSEMAFLQHFLPGQPTEKSKQTSIGLQSQNTFLLTPDQQLDIGFDSEFAVTDLLQEQNQETVGSAFLKATIPAGKQYDYQANIFTLAPFLQYTQQISEQFKLIAGMRAEYSYFAYSNNMVDGRVDENGEPCGFGGCRYTRPASRDDDFLIFSPKVGVIYQINQEQSAFLNISHGFRMPQTSELYRLQREQTVADLAPEEVLAVEASWQYQSAEIELSTQVYYQDKKHVILRNTDFFTVSNGETSHRGIEFAFKHYLSDYFSWLINGSYNLHQYENNPGLSEKDIIGNDIDTAPRKLANLFLTYENAKWLVELQTQYTGKYYLDAENEHSYHGHVLLNNVVKYQWQNDLAITLNVDNLLDKPYAERADYTSFSQERYFPGQGRNVRLSIHWDF